jgi:hypothetical protein
MGLFIIVRRKNLNVWSWVVYLLAFLFVVGGILTLYYGIIYLDGFFSWKSLVNQSLGNFGIGLIDTAITILIIDNVYQFRERRALFMQLLRQVRSKDNTTALQALDDLQANGFLNKKVFYKSNLSGANLENAQLFAGLNMSGTKFSHAILKNVNFHNTELNSAVLSDTDLRDADFISTSLIGASLIKANLQNAILQGVKMQRAVLNGADLTNATIQGETFDDETILPDGTNWNPDIQISRFTNPADPNYWTPDRQRKS